LEAVSVSVEINRRAFTRRNIGDRDEGQVSKLDDIQAVGRAGKFNIKFAWGGFEAVTLTVLMEEETPVVLPLA